MELQDFIAQTLVSIRKGLGAANRELMPSEQSKNFVYTMGPRFAKASEGMKDSYIEFDVAVMASEKVVGESGGGVGIKVIALQAEAGGKTKKTISQDVVTRIKFSIVVHRATA